MRKVFALLVVGIFLACGLAYSQNISSSIIGNVTDPSGSPVPGVKVTATNMGTGVSATVTTGSAGTYSIPELLAGQYSVRATKSGFKTYTARNIQLLSAEVSRVNIQLTVGSVHQTVSVTGRAPLVHTDSMSISSSVTTEQLSNLPTSLQTIDTFVGLGAGVQSLGGDANNPPIAGSTHWGSVNFTLNGVSAIQPGNGGGVDIQNVGMLVLPPPSSLKELKIQSTDMSAKYKDKANVDMMIKNGTNRFHGEAYEYVQNTMLNANEFILNALGENRPAEHLNQFGGNFGGPIWHNKAFFFFDYNGYRRQDSAIGRHNYPSMAMRQGDFSALCTANGGTFDATGVCSAGAWQLYNPFTGDPYANNMIPTGSQPGDITSQAQAFLKYLPAVDPSSLGLPGELPNYTAVIPQKRNANAYDLRIDYNLSKRDRLFGVWSERIADPWNVANSGYTATYGSGRYFYKHYDLSATETHTFNSNTLNSFRASWADYIQRFSGQNGDFSLQSLFPSSPSTLFNGLPLVNVTGYTNLFHDVGTAYPTPQYSVELTDDFTHIQGRHTFEAGIDETGFKIFSRHTAGTNTGRFNFLGRWTGRDGWPGVTSKGNAFADFLIGTPYASYTPGIGVFAKMIYSRQWGVYAQDIWQVSRNFTINYGLRYDYQTPWQYRTQQTTTFNIGANAYVLPQNSATATFPHEGANQELFNAYPYVTTQSLGLPLQYIQPDKNNFAPRVGIAWRPFGGTRTVLRAGYGVYYNLGPAYVGGRNEAWNPPWLLGITEPFTTDLPAHAKVTTAYMPDITFADPFPSSNNKFPVSPHPKVIWLSHDFKNAVIQDWNLTLEHQFGNNWVTRISYVGNQSHHLPYNADNINVPITQTPNVNLQQQRPLQPWGVVNTWRSAGKQNFNQLQLMLRHRFAGGFSFQGQYQYTRSLDNVPNAGGPQNWHFPNQDYGNSGFIRRHFAVFSYIYQLPIGRNRHWLAGARGVENAVLGGWQVSGITNYAGGLPFSVTTSKSGVKGVSGWIVDRADRVSGTPIYAGQQSGHDILSGVQWFNTAAFAPPAEWTWGNSARNSVWGPGFWNWDISTMKTFHLTEKVRLQFRSDFLDAFNHFNLGSPDHVIPDLRDGGNNIANSGKITGGSGYRKIQLALRLMF